MVTVILRHQKRILIVLNATLLLAVSWFIVFAFLPISIEAKQTAPVMKKAVKIIQPDKPRQLPRKNYAAIYGKPLRGPLVQAEPVAGEIPPEPVETVSNLQIQLLGTVVESNHMYGLFRGADGKEKLVGIGKKIDTAEVVDIKEKTAVVKHAGRLVTLKVIKQQQPTQASPDNNVTNVRPGTRPATRSGVPRRRSSTIRGINQ